MKIELCVGVSLGALFLHMLISGYVERGLQLTYLVHGNIQSFDSMMYIQTHPPSHVAGASALTPDSPRNHATISLNRNQQPSRSAAGSAGRAWPRRGPWRAATKRTRIRAGTCL